VSIAFSGPLKCSVKTAIVHITHGSLVLGRGVVRSIPAHRHLCRPERTTQITKGIDQHFTQSFLRQCNICAQADVSIEQLVEPYRSCPGIYQSLIRTESDHNVVSTADNFILLQFYRCDVWHFRIRVGFAFCSFSWLLIYAMYFSDKIYTRWGFT